MEMIQVHYVYVSLLLHIIHMSINMYFHVETEYLRVKIYSMFYSEIKYKLWKRMQPPTSNLI